jgi:hypothetical protein
MHVYEENSAENELWRSKYLYQMSYPGSRKGIPFLKFFDSVNVNYGTRNFLREYGSMWKKTLLIKVKHRMKLFPNHEPVCPNNRFCRRGIKLFYIPCYRRKFWFSTLECLSVDIITIALLPLLFPYLGHSYIVLLICVENIVPSPKPSPAMCSTNNNELSTDTNITPWSWTNFSH